MQLRPLTRKIQAEPSVWGRPERQGSPRQCRPWGVQISASCFGYLWRVLTAGVQRSYFSYGPCRCFWKHMGEFASFQHISSPEKKHLVFSLNNPREQCGTHPSDRGRSQTSMCLRAALCRPRIYIGGWGSSRYD